MPKVIKREFLTGPRKLEEIMEKLDIIINETSTNGPCKRWYARGEDDTE